MIAATAITGKWHVGFNHGVAPGPRLLNMPAGGLRFSNQTGPNSTRPSFGRVLEIATACA